MSHPARHWPSLQAANNYHRKEGFVTGRYDCAACGGRQQGATEPGLDLSQLLKCGLCGKSAARFVPDNNQTKTE